MHITIETAKAKRGQAPTIEGACTNNTAVVIRSDFAIERVLPCEDSKSYWDKWSGSGFA